jgi:UDP-hydrolysing UDP-N-acetyl-D-glucosamine 2-epimerase
MSKRKVCVVLTMRASYAKIKPILKAIQKHQNLELQVVLAASALLDRFGNLESIVQNDGFEINGRIYMVVEGENLVTSAKSTGIGVVEFATCFQSLKPDVVVVIGDRYELMSPAIAATYMNIPLAHVQGGEITGNIDEKVRHAVTKLADVHFPSTALAAERIVKMGEDPDMVFFTGCPSIDIAKDATESPALTFDLYKKYGGVGAFPDLSNGYYIVMQHPVTTEYPNGRGQIEETLHAMNRFDTPVIWFWPNVDAGGDEVSKGIRMFRENEKPVHMHFIKNMEPQDFLRLLNGAKGIIGNSSAGIRESSYLGTPSVNIGSRQVHRERGPNVLDVGYDREAIYTAVSSHCTGKKPSSDLYGKGNAGELIADALDRATLGYTKYLRI